MNFFPASCDSPLPLPLGMRLTQLVTRNKPQYASDFHSQHDVLLGNNCTSRNVIPRNIERRVQTGKFSNYWQVGEDEVEASKPCPVSSSGFAKTEQTIPNRRFSLTESLKQRSLDMYRNLYRSKKNTKRLTQKSIVYQELYRREQIKLREHRDIENFQRLYIDSHPKKTIAHQELSAKSEKNFNFFPILKNNSNSCLSGDSFEIQLNESEPKIWSSTDRVDNSPYFDSPGIYSENFANFENSFSSKMQAKEKRSQHFKEVPTAEDLFRHECGIAKKLSSSGMYKTDCNDQYSSHLPSNQPSENETPFYSEYNLNSVDESPFENSPIYNSQNVELDNDSISGEFSSAPLKESVRNRYTNSPSINSVNEYSNSARQGSSDCECSYSPEENYKNYEYSNSSAAFSQNSDENYKLKDETPYSFYNQNNLEKTPLELRYPKERNLTPLISYLDERDENVIIEKFRL